MSKNTEPFQSAMHPPVPSSAWDSGPPYLPLDSLKAAKRFRTLLAANLRQGTPEQQVLSRRLSECNREDRCGSQACPVCARQDNRWYAAEVQRFLAEITTRNAETRTRVVSVCASPLSFRCRFGAVDFDLPQIKAWLRNELVRCGLGNLIVVGFLNFKAVQWDSQMQNGAWSVRWDLLITGDGRNANRAAIRNAFAQSCSLSVGMDCLKSCSARFYDPTYFWMEHCKNVADYNYYFGSEDTEELVMPVPPAVHRDMAMFLDHWRFADRVFLQGAEFSGWEIKGTTPQRPALRVISSD